MNEAITTVSVKQHGFLSVGEGSIEKSKRRFWAEQQWNMAALPSPSNTIWLLEPDRSRASEGKKLPQRCCQDVLDLPPQLHLTWSLSLCLSFSLTLPTLTLSYSHRFHTLLPLSLLLPATCILCVREGHFWQGDSYDAVCVESCVWSSGHLLLLRHIQKCTVAN